MPVVELDTVRVDEPDPVTLVGLSWAVMLGEEVEAVRFTTPLKPSRAVTVMVEVPDVLPVTEIVVGLAFIVKSCTVKVTVAE